MGGEPDNLGPKMDASKGLATEFQFLPGLATTYSSEIRAFVLRKYMAKRKNRARARNKLEPSNDKDETQVDATATGRSSRRSTESAAYASTYQAGRDADECGPLVSTRLGMGRVDPFLTYARVTNSVENARIDECEYPTSEH